MTLDTSKVKFAASLNVLKVAFNDFKTVSVPVGRTTILLFAHNLGYIPRARVFYEPVSGQVWPLPRDQFDSLGGGTGTTLDIYGTFYFTTTGLYLYIANGAIGAKNIKFYYRIYLDE